MALTLPPDELFGTGADHRPPERRRVAIVLEGVADADGPDEAVAILRALLSQGYVLYDPPADGAELVMRLAGRVDGEEISLIDYSAWFAGLPEAERNAVTKRWGPPEADPAFRPGELDCGHFPIRACRCGKVAIGLQPTRSGNAPPHGVLAFEAWLRLSFRADAELRLGAGRRRQWRAVDGAPAGRR